MHKISRDYSTKGKYQVPGSSLSSFLKGKKEKKNSDTKIWKKEMMATKSSFFLRGR
jgi:hypothetical protein